MRISITGGSGFIGRELIKKSVNEGHEVRVLTRGGKYFSGVDVFNGDLCDRSHQHIVRDFLSGADILYHCAGEIHDNNLMRRLHCEGTKRLVDAANGRVGRWIQLSSVGAYGRQRDCVVSERTEESPVGIYETTKKESDDIVRNSGLPFVILRPSNIFGKTMTNQSLYKLIETIRAGLFVYIGRKGALVNYVHVDDVVAALFRCGCHPRAIGEVFNLSQSIEIEEFARAICLDLEGERTFLRVSESFMRAVAFFTEKISNFPLTTARVDALTSFSRYDSEKITRELGFEFELPLEERLMDFSQFI